MRPDRIVVGEVRGAEVFDMLQAMSTGHDGSIATIHANSARECLGRLEMMMLLSGFPIPQRAMRQQVAAAVNMIVHVARLSDGSRKLMKISEISEMEGEMIMMQDLYEFNRTDIRPDGSIVGDYRPTGIRSSYARRLEIAGYKTDTRLIRTGED
jgi:pilus assembly protein CpaF